MPRALEDFCLKLKRWLPPLAWMALIIVMSLDWSSDFHTRNILRPFLLWLEPGMSEDRIYHANIFVRKLAHLLQFAVLGVLVWRAHLRKFQPEKMLDWRGIRFALLAALVFAIASEGTQYFISTRTASFTDIAIDMAGTVLGLAAEYAHRRWRHSRTFKEAR